MLRDKKVKIIHVVPDLKTRQPGTKEVRMRNDFARVPSFAELLAGDAKSSIKYAIYMVPIFVGREGFFTN